MTACHRVRAKCWRAKARHRGHGNIEAGMACPPPTVCAERGRKMAKIDGLTTPARPPGPESRLPFGKTAGRVGKLGRN